MTNLGTIFANLALAAERDALRAEVARLLATEAAIRADERAKVIAECGQSVTGCIVYDENWARAVDAIDLVHTPDSRAIAEAKSA